MTSLTNAAQGYTKLEESGDPNGGTWYWELTGCTWYQASGQYRGLSCVLWLKDYNRLFCESPIFFDSPGKSWSYYEYMISAYPDQNGSHTINISEPTPLHEYTCYN